MGSWTPSHHPLLPKLPLNPDHPSKVLLTLLWALQTILLSQALPMEEMSYSFISTFWRNYNSLCLRGRYILVRMQYEACLLHRPCGRWLMCPYTFKSGDGGMSEELPLRLWRASTWDKVIATLSQCQVMDKNCKIFQWLSLSAGYLNLTLFFSILQSYPSQPYPFLLHLSIPLSFVLSISSFLTWLVHFSTPAFPQFCC